VDRSGDAIGTAVSTVGDNYVEVEREGGAWFVPGELLEPGADGALKLLLSREQVRALEAA
jgi:hypothetical protein